MPETQTDTSSPDAPRQPDIEELRRQGHEPNALNMSLVWSVVAGLVLLVLVAMVLMDLMFDSLASRGRRPEQLSPSIRRVRPQPAEPSLDASQREHLRDIRAAEETVLSSYEWIDKEKGVARIPVNRAMEIIAKYDGLPRPSRADTTALEGQRTVPAQNNNADSGQSKENDPP